MVSRQRAPSELQREYYARTAAHYDAMHVRAHDEHHVALRHVAGMVDAFGYRSVLDVGCGTGRGLLELRRSHPELRLVGVEPVTALAEQAVANGVPREDIVEASGEALPFDDGSFDAVVETGVLHHVPDPSRVVAEMTRVARHAVFLSDDNRFGWGSPPVRLAKLALWKAGLWPAARRLRTRGRGYRVSADDGIAWSYSVYDSYAQLAEWADRVVLVPTDAVTSASWLTPLLTSRHVLLCAVRDDRPEEEG